MHECARLAPALLQDYDRPFHRPTHLFQSSSACFYLSQPTYSTVLPLSNIHWPLVLIYSIAHDAILLDSSPLCLSTCAPGWS